MVFLLSNAWDGKACNREHRICLFSLLLCLFYVEYKDLSLKQSIMQNTDIVCIKTHNYAVSVFGIKSKHASWFGAFLKLAYLVL